MSDAGSIRAVGELRQLVICDVDADRPRHDRP